MDKINSFLGGGGIGDIVEDQIRDKAADAAGEKWSDWVYKDEASL